MELIDAVRSRRSVSRLVDPAPSDEQIVNLVAEAATGPDHGLLRPWRLIIVRGEARHTLGHAFAAALADDDPAGRERAAAKPLRAPLLLSIVLEPRDNPKVPEWEQIAATTTMVHNLSLLLHAGGWGAMWRTGAPAVSPHVRELLGLSAGERLLGWLYIGTAQERSVPPRPRFEPHDRIYALSPAGTVEPLAAAAR